MPPKRPDLAPLNLSFKDPILENLTRIEPAVDPKVSLKKINDVIERFKHMKKEDILELFTSEYVNQHIEVEYNVLPDPDRQVIEIIKPESKSGQKFYKSHGVSRGDNQIKDIWFPFVERQFHIFVKPEDKYIASVERLGLARMSELDASHVLTLLRDPTLHLYGRFMDFTNASICAKLYYENI